MDIINNIHRSILALEELGSNLEDIKITTSRFTQRVIARELHINGSSAPITPESTRMFGVEVSFDHFSNEIVIYDKESAPNGSVSVSRIWINVTRRLWGRLGMSGAGCWCTG
jgi:hypothetical protein